MALIQTWLEGTLQQVLQGTLTRSSASSFSAASASLVQQDLMAGLPGFTSSSGGDIGTGTATHLGLLEGAVHVYQVAFNELRKQVGDSIKFDFCLTGAIMLTQFRSSQVATECKERADLMGLLLGRLTSLVDLKAGFEAEDRLVDMQEEYLRLLGGYQGLEQNIKVWEFVIRG